MKTEILNNGIITTANTLCVVIDENILAIIHDEYLNTWKAGIIAESITRGANVGMNAVFIDYQFRKIRTATLQDFEGFRVESRGYFQTQPFTVQYGVIKDFNNDIILPPLHAWGKITGYNPQTNNNMIVQTDLKTALTELLSDNNQLKVAVAQEALKRGDNEDIAVFFKDQLNNGSNNGSVGFLIMTSDCNDFYYNHFDEIQALCNEWELSTGETLNTERPYWYAHFGFGETVREIANDLGIDF